jgi:hypothetical protein
MRTRKQLVIFIGGLALLLLGGAATLAPSSLAQRDVEGRAPLRAGAPAQGTATATSTPACTPTWTVVPGPSVGSDAELNGVAVIAPDDAWAVGSASGGLPTQTWHWDGSAWSSVPSPGGGELLALAAVASNDVWAVGNRGLIEHWNGSAWSSVSGPTTGNLLAVAAVAADDVWAAGFTTGSVYQTLTLHWDGASWAIIPSPNMGAGQNVLEGIAVAGPNHVWAAGFYTNGGTRQTLTEQWNGTNWSVVASPNRGTGANELWSVAAGGANDVWAVGYYQDTSYSETLIEHWNGANWLVVPSPNPGAGNVLRGVAVAAPNDVWAVGRQDLQTLVEHWDGLNWAVMPSPNVGTGTNELMGVAARAPNDVWTVGGYLDASVGRGLTAHYGCLPPSPTPTATVTGTPPAATVTPYLDLLPAFYVDPLGCDTAVFHLDVWVAPAGAYVPVTTTMYFSNGWGEQQEFVIPPHSGIYTINCNTGPCHYGAYYYSMVVDLHNDLVETNEQNNYIFGQISTPPYCYPTPAPSSTHATLTPSATHATLTPSATPCGGFRDVHLRDYFYTPVQYLACHGSVTGYGDGTFRPYNPTTRAQMVKIVTLGFALPVQTPFGGDYTFADVPPAQPFFAVIETAAAQAIITGYTCGGPGEPCDAQHHLYFRPNANVTRGQLSKITVQAAAWALISPPVGTFADVPPASPFYPFVETAACHGLISGYGCGGPGEPCDAERRPYFRQGTTATRGQIAKIVYGALTASQPCVLQR